jgi:hypothetical protein
MSVAVEVKWEIRGCSSNGNIRPILEESEVATTRAT